MKRKRQSDLISDIEDDTREAKHQVVCDTESSLMWLNHNEVEKAGDFIEYNIDILIPIITLKEENERED